MGFWKILGGVAIGVGAVAAAPFTGGGSILGAATLAGSLAGAGTIAAAVGAGVVGAAVGAAMNDDDDIREEGRREGEMKAEAEYFQEIERLRESLKSAMQRVKASGDYYNALVAMMAVAVAAANADGFIHPDEKEEIEMFLTGRATEFLPEDVLSKLHGLYENPVNIREAFQMAKNSKLDTGIFDEIINITVYADGVVHEDEKAFVQAWNELKVA